MNNDQDGGGNDSDEVHGGWDDVPLAEIGEGELPALEAMDEEEMEDLASMLMERPPMLRQLRGPKLEAAADGAVDAPVEADFGGSDDDAGAVADAASNSNAAGGGAVPLPSRRAQIKARAARMKEEDEMQTTGEGKGGEEVKPNFETYVNPYSRGVDVAPSSRAPTLPIERSAREEGTAARIIPPFEGAGDEVVEGAAAEAEAISLEMKGPKEGRPENNFVGALRSFLPTPPLQPPTPKQIDSNGDVTNANLSKINRDLQGTLAKQRKSLGNLRL